MRQRWTYKDAIGLDREGFYRRAIERGGTDITYVFQRDDGRIDLVSGSRLREARNITAEYCKRTKED